MTDLLKTGNRLVYTLLVARSLYAASTIIMFTVASIVAVDLAGGNSLWTGVPSTLSLVGAAVIAYPVGRLMDVAGRRTGLTLGFLLGGAGAAISGWAAIAGSLPVLLAGAFITGTSRSTIEMGRFAAAEANPPSRRGRAISLFVLGGTIGSVVGPPVTAFSNNLGLSFGLPDLSGPWFAGAIIYGLGALLMFGALRPDPKQLIARFAALEPEQEAPAPGDVGRKAAEVLRDDRAKAAIGAMVFGTLAMATVMTVTPVHMHGIEHPISAISLVIMAHTIGMFGLSYLTGWLVDRVGRETMIIAGGVVLVAACLMAPFNNGVTWLASSLFLLGLGWNLTYVAGSTLLDDLLKPHEKGRVQGSADTMVNVASAIGSLGSGLAFAASGFAFTSWATILLAAIPIVLVLTMRTPDRAVPVGGAAGD